MTATNSSLNDFRKNASEESLGLSSAEILNDIVSYLAGSKELHDNAPKKIFDIGCGTGNLLTKIETIFPQAELTGCDYTNFESLENERINFFQFDCNKDLPDHINGFDLVTSSEVIEHIENPRHFARQVMNSLAPGGIAIVSTPNLESITSLISFFIRGYHSAFGGKSYPAHITPVALFDMKNAFIETGKAQVLKAHFVQNGRMPGSSKRWKSLFPFLTGKRFSDNYFIVVKKVS